jgi:hypothetical protein
MQRSTVIGVKKGIALYCMYLSVIESACVTQLLINPIIRTRTRLNSDVTRHNINMTFKSLSNFSSRSVFTLKEIHSDAEIKINILFFFPLRKVLNTFQL